MLLFSSRCLCGFCRHISEQALTFFPIERFVGMVLFRNKPADSNYINGHFSQTPAPHFPCSASRMGRLSGIEK